MLDLSAWNLQKWGTKMSNTSASLEQNILLVNAEVDQQIDLLQDFLNTLEEKGLNKPKIKTAAKKTAGQQAAPRVVLPDPVPVKILQEYCTFQCGCGSHHRFLMKSLVGYKAGTGTAFKEVLETTDKIRKLIEDGVIESEERHVQVLACNVCGGL